MVQWVRENWRGWSRSHSSSLERVCSGAPRGLSVGAVGAGRRGAPWGVRGGRRTGPGRCLGPGGELVSPLSREGAARGSPALSGRAPQLTGHRGDAAPGPAVTSASRHYGAEWLLLHHILVGESGLPPTSRSHNSVALEQPRPPEQMTLKQSQLRRPRPWSP